jgi:hypothetical protein
MIEISENQVQKNRRGRPRLDIWRVLPSSLDQALAKIRFFDAGMAHARLEYLPDPELFDFRARFTAAFLRYLVVSQSEPETAVVLFQRSWRQFQRYLVGGDQTPKVAVVQQLAAAAHIPIDWIIGARPMGSVDVQAGMVILNIFDLIFDAFDGSATLSARPFKAHMPLDMVGVDPDRARSIALVLVKGVSSKTHIADGDSIVIDQSVPSHDVLSPGSLVLVQNPDNDCFDVIELSAHDVLTGQDTVMISQRNGSKLKEWTMVGRVIWIGRRT